MNKFKIAEGYPSIFYLRQRITIAISFAPQTARKIICRATGKGEDDEKDINGATFFADGHVRNGGVCRLFELRQSAG